MFQILKLALEGKGAYRIARELKLDPPTVYRALEAAKKNFKEVDEMLKELKDRGWPDKLQST